MGNYMGDYIWSAFVCAPLPWAILQKEIYLQLCTAVVTKAMAKLKGTNQHCGIYPTYRRKAGASMIGKKRESLQINVETYLLPTPAVAGAVSCLKVHE